MPARTAAAWRPLLNYFETLAEYHIGSQLFGNSDSTTERVVLIYKDRHTITTMNPYLQLHLHLGCGSKCSMDYAIKDETILLPDGLRTALKNAKVDDKSWYCAQCSTANARRPANPPSRTIPRSFDPESVGHKWMFDAKYIKVESTTGKRWVLYACLQVNCHLCQES